MIQLRSTNVQEAEGIQRQPTFTKNINRRSSYTESETFNKYHSPTSPFVLKKPLVKKTFVHVPQNVQETVSNTSYRETEPEEFKQKINMSPNFVFNNYKITDLTYSLIKSRINLGMLTIYFLIQIIIRYFSIGCLFFLMIQISKPLFWQWIIIWGFNNFLYFVCIVKISIKFPETQSENILKDSFNSLQQSDHVEYFQVIDSKKLRTSIIRGLIPPELSFLYIKDMRTRQRHLHIYVMINYIYNSIEAVLFYPFIIVYTVEVYRAQVQKHYGWVFYISYVTILISEATFIILSVFLTIYGCRKKGYLVQPKSS